MTDARPADRPPPRIRGELVYLRPAERDDLDTFVRWFADAETTSWLGVRAPFSRAMEDQWFDKMVADQGKTSYHFVICRLTDDQPLGTAGLFELDHENGSAAFGISVGEKGEWNKGYGTDALSAISDFGFGELRLERIWLEVYDPNARARRSYHKAGFTHEGTLRRSHFSRGQHWDAHVMSLLREEWLALPRPKSWELNEPG
jgi:RimJ/RimL family protein N-acetyltransferase